jgi:hypothetical protein
VQCQGELAVPEEDENSDVDKVGFVKDSHDIPHMNSLPLQEEEEFMKVTDDFRRTCARMFEEENEEAGGMLRPSCIASVMSPVWPRCFLRWKTSWYKQIDSCTTSFRLQPM